MGAVTNMLLGAVRAGFRRPYEGKAILEQIEALGVASVGIVTVTSVFIGMVMAVQFAFGLRKFGGMEYTGRVVPYWLTIARCSRRRLHSRDRGWSHRLRHGRRSGFDVGDRK